MAPPRRFSDEERKIRKRASEAKHRAANPDQYREKCRKKAARLRAANPEHYRKKDTEYRKAHPDRIKKSIRKTHLKRLYGLTVAEYDAMVVTQNGRCAVCDTNKLEKGKHWCVDHCHKTNAIRRLLCHSCNLGLGLFHHDIILLQSAVTYLREFHPQSTGVHLVPVAEVGFQAD